MKDKEIVLVIGDTSDTIRNQVQHIAMNCGHEIIIIEERTDTLPDPLEIVIPPPEEMPKIELPECPYWNRQKRGKGNKFKAR